MDDDYPIFWGTGSLHDLREAETRSHRLDNLRSVSDAARKALTRPAPQQPRNPIGFGKRT